MKIKILLTTLLISLCAGAAVRMVYGKSVTATTTPQCVLVGSDGNYALSCSVNNTGSQTVYVTLGTSTNGFVLTNAIPISADTAYTFDKDPVRPRYIYGVVFATESTSSSIDIAFE